MAGKPIAGDGLTENMAGMTKNQLYDIMSQMKTLIEQNKQQARDILIQNPVLTKALFQAQIMLGMMQPQVIANIHPAATQQPQQSSQPSQQSNLQATHPLPVPKQEQNAVPQIPPPMRKQHQNQNSIPISSSALHPANLQSQTMPSHPMQTQPQPKGHLNTQMSQMSIPQSSQLPAVPLPPHHSATQPPTLHQPQIPNVSTQLQQPIQTTGIHQLPMQTPIPPQPRMPSGPGFHHQYGPPMGHNVGFQHGGPQHQSQSMFHPVNKPQTGMGPSFPQGQPHHQSQLPPPYQGGGSHMGPEFNNQGGNSMQVDRGSWMSGTQESSPMAQLLAPPQLVPGQMGPGNQSARSSSLTPEMEKALLQQVMSLTPEQINLLPPEQRNQVLQLQQMLRQ